MYALVRAHDDYVCTARGYVPPVKACDTPDRVGRSERGSVSVGERVRAPACPSVERKEPSAENRKDPQHKLKESFSDPPRKAPSPRRKPPNRKTQIPDAILESSLSGPALLPELSAETPKKIILKCSKLPRSHDLILSVGQIPH